MTGLMPLFHIVYQILCILVKVRIIKNCKFRPFDLFLQIMKMKEHNRKIPPDVMQHQLLEIEGSLQIFGDTIVNS